MVMTRQMVLSVFGKKEQSQRCSSMRRKVPEQGIRYSIVDEVGALEDEGIAAVDGGGVLWSMVMLMQMMMMVRRMTRCADQSHRDHQVDRTGVGMQRHLVQWTELHLVLTGKAMGQQYLDYH